MKYDEGRRRDAAWRVEDVMAEFDSTLDAEEYRHLGINRGRIVEGFRTRLDRIASDLEFPATQLDLAERGTDKLFRLSDSMRRPHVFVPPLLNAALVAVTTWILDAGLGYYVLWGASMSLLLFVYSAVREYRRQRDSIDALVEARSNAYAAARRRLVGEAVRLTINEVYKGTGVLPFPTIAPALVELSASAVVASRPQRYVADFVKSHKTSAIGIAGLRGAGKSSLLRAMCAQPVEEQISICLAAPVQYDRLDFTRRLVLEASKGILEAEGVDLTLYDTTALRARHRERMSLLAAFGAGFALVFLDTIPTASRLGPLAVAGAAVCVYALTMLARGARPPANPVRLPKSPRPHTRLAAELYEAIEWEREQSVTSNTTVKPFGGILSADEGGSIVRRRRARSHPDLVADFTKVLTAYSEEPDARRLVFVVDELDKLGTSAELVDAVNGMKDLFHIPNVHFLVSVSTDALARFEQRGLPTRDAFDSAFDTIVHVGPPTVEESVKVVHERATGFPRGLAIFCHAWAGGLPRDLLRAARACVELQRRSASALTAAEIVVEVVTSDLESVAASRLAGGAVSGDSDREAGEAEAVALLGLKDVTARLRRGDVGEQDALSEVRALEANAPSLAEVMALAKTGLATLFFFKRAVLWVTEKQEAEHDVVGVANTIAAAVGGLSLPRPARDRAVGEALEASGLERP